MFPSRTQILAAAIVAVAVFAGAARAGTVFVYTDAAGDNASAPDIQKVTLNDAGDGTVGVEIDLAAGIPNDGSALMFGIDADRNQQTGDNGDEYMVFIGPDSAGLARWDGSNWSTFNHQAISPNMVGGRTTFTLTLADLGVSVFDFWVGAAHGNDEDDAPEHGMFTFPQTATKPSIQSVLLSASALIPKAGKTLAIPSVQVKLSTNQIVSADSVTCTLTYKGKAIAPVGTCAWKIPKAYRKKRLVLTLNASYQDATSTLTLPVFPR